MAFVGRCHWEKGPVEAITVAVRAGIPLKMALRVTVPERPYFDEKIRPLLETHSGLIEYVGEIGGGSAQICMAKPERWFSLRPGRNRSVSP